MMRKSIPYSNRLYAYYIGDTFQYVGSKQEIQDLYGFSDEEIKRMMRKKLGKGPHYESTPLMILLEPFDDEGNPVI